MSRLKGPLPFAVDFSSLKAAAPSLRPPLVLVAHKLDTMALLWKPENWSQRLAELEARTGDLKEAPLRRDVRSLGMLLGEVLREQAGEDLFKEEEEIRQTPSSAGKHRTPANAKLRKTFLNRRWQMFMHSRSNRHTH